MILPKLIQSNLKTVIIGQQIKYYSQLDSTNQKACELIALNEGTHGTLVVTDNQHLGKGRRNNNWFMGTGKGVAVSLILDNPLSKEDTLFLPLITGIATVKSLCSDDVVPKLKWPNDLMINSKKIGGILCESRISSSEVKYIIIGLGINVNETIEDLPEYLHQTATSLFIETGEIQQRELIISEFLNTFETELRKFKKDKKKIIKDWEFYCGHMNEEISFTYNGEKLFGLFLGLNSSGEAVTKINGENQTFYSIILD